MATLARCILSRADYGGTDKVAGALRLPLTLEMNSDASNYKENAYLDQKGGNQNN